MKGLLLDTSGHTPIIALSDQGKLIRSSEFFSLKTSNTLSSDINRLLKEIDLPIHQLEYISIGIGPGSFLGTRIGVITAKSLSYGLKIPLVSFCSLQAYQPIEFGDFYVISDAKSKGVYLLKGCKTTENVIYESIPSLYSIEELKELVNKNPTIISPHKEELLHKMPFLSEILISSTPFLPYLCEHCYEKFSLSKIETLDSLSVHYLRLS